MTTSSSQLLTMVNDFIASLPYERQPQSTPPYVMSSLSEENACDQYLCSLPITFIRSIQKIS